MCFYLTCIVPPPALVTAEQLSQSFLICFVFNDTPFLQTWQFGYKLQHSTSYPIYIYTIYIYIYIHRHMYKITHLITLSFSLSLSLYIYIYVFMYICTYVYTVPTTQNKHNSLTNRGHRVGHQPGLYESSGQKSAAISSAFALRVYLAFAQINIYRSY